MPGIPARQDVEYPRHGSAVLLPELKLQEGTVAGAASPTLPQRHFVEFLADLVTQTRAGIELSCIVDNLGLHHRQGRCLLGDPPAGAPALPA